MTTTSRSIDRILSTCRASSRWSRIDPTSCLWIVGIHFQVLNILIIVPRMSWMMNDGRVLPHKPTRIIQTLKSIFIVSDTMAIGWFWFIDVFQMWILHHQLLDSFRPIVLRWPLLVETTLNEICLSVIQTLHLHSSSGIAATDMLSVVKSRRIKSSWWLIHSF